ncbi:MAG: hypothetical protein NC341_10560 [Blautia sp.]|nr:hypothetical protein [Blautia sp.]MCM1202282.1 hypothetical protein [Bacteroides fragilis]
MYFKLAFRNAKRSVFDYLLYIFTMIVLTSIICLSNHIAIFGNMQAGFQTISLPLVIVLIMAVLVEYINAFLVKQRAKEFAAYILLGMEKRKLSLIFLLEISLIGIICFVLGVLSGTCIYYISFYAILHGNNRVFDFQVMLKSIIYTFGYFCIVEFISMFRMVCKINSLEIKQLMQEKQRNQSFGVNKKLFWKWMLICSFSAFFIMLCSIVFGANRFMYILISIVSIPLLVSVFAFYKWLYACLSAERLFGIDALYQGDRLYWISEMTANTRTSAILNAVFSLCLLFSAMAFVFGMLLLSWDIGIWTYTDREWMGFLQISICIVFIVIYFSIMSFLQITELKKQKKRIQILRYMGKNQNELKKLIKTQIQLKLILPTIMCFILILISAPLVSYKLDSILPAYLHNFVLIAVGWFMICFVILYFCYYFLTYIISRQYMKF